LSRSGSSFAASAPPAQTPDIATAHASAARRKLCLFTMLPSSVLVTRQAFAARA
jgi:hypothetical protein